MCSSWLRHHKVQEVRCLLERVGTVSDHDPVNVVLRQEFVDAMGKFEPVVARQAGTSDLEELLAPDIRSVP
jgi:hypothetical protein